MSDSSKYKKREIPSTLKKLLEIDSSLTTSFCLGVDKLIPLDKHRKYYKTLEISCHALPWIALTLASIWILWKPELFQIQINFLLGLLIDIVDISLLKAFVRRRRPSGNHSDMFFTVGPDQYSFPSGHVSRAVFISCFFIRIYPSKIVLHSILIFWTIAVSLSRILLRRHHILDVLAGCVLGLAEDWILSVIWLSNSTSLWIASSLADEATNLEGLDDTEIFDNEL